MRAFLLVWMILFLGPKVIFSQTVEPGFTAYGNCIILDEDKSATDVLNDVKKTLKNRFGNSVSITVPKKIAQSELRPLVGNTLYVFSKSKYIGSTKVKNVYLFNNEIADWEVHFKADFTEIRKAIGDVDFHESIEAFSDVDINVEELKRANDKNQELLKTNVLTAQEIKEIRSLIKKNKPEGAPKKISNYSKVLLSLKLEPQKLKIILFQGFDGSEPEGLIVCKTEKGIYFNYLGGDHTGFHFDQIVNWLGTYYISFYDNGVGGYTKSIYKISENGLVRVGGGSVSFD